MAYVIVAVFATNECRLLSTPEQFETLKKQGKTDQEIEEITVCPYHYLKASHALIEIVIQKVKAENNLGLAMGLSVHYHTSLSVMYPEIDPLMRELWEVMFTGEEYVSEAYSRIFKNQDDLERVYLQSDDFLRNPRSIMPHIWIPDHPLAKKAQELHDFWKKKK